MILKISNMNAPLNLSRVKQTTDPCLTNEILNYFIIGISYKKANYSNNKNDYIINKRYEIGIWQKLKR